MLKRVLIRVPVTSNNVLRVIKPLRFIWINNFCQHLQIVKYSAIDLLCI